MRASPPKERFPWLLLLALVATVGLFWVLPHYLPPREVQVEFAAPAEGYNVPGKRPAP